jgi:LmbE family N-acetylglucosaminyl deacetylase
MERRQFIIGQSLAGGMLLGGPAAAAPQLSQRNVAEQAEVFLERDQPGQPHKGKVLAAIQPHNDDVPLFAAGTVIKLIKEGYTGILIRVTNDEMAGRGATVGEVVLNNEKDNFEVARRMGLKKVFDLHYRNHRLDAESHVEVRARLVFIFRIMKVDTVICYDPWGHYEENPDHYMTARCVEAASWMAGGGWDFPEHGEAGIHPHGVREKYYFARGPQLVNRVVDISSVIDQKVEVNLANVTQGPAGEGGARLRERLAKEGKRLPILGTDDATANRQYIKNFVLSDDIDAGKKYGVPFAEPFHYIGPPDTKTMADYIQQHAVPL